MSVHSLILHFHQFCLLPGGYELQCSLFPLSSQSKILICQLCLVNYYLLYADFIIVDINRFYIIFFFFTFQFVSIFLHQAWPSRRS